MNALNVFLSQFTQHSPRLNFIHIIMKYKIPVFCFLLLAIQGYGQNSNSLGRITFSTGGISDSRLSVTMGEPIVGSNVSSNGTTILTIGGQANNPLPLSPSDSLTVSTNSINVTSNSNTPSVQLKSNRTWIVNNTANWITVAPMSGQKDTTLNISIAQNSSNNQRSSIITITAGTVIRTITITQSGVPLPQDSLNISATSLNINSNQKDTFIQILSNRSWTIDNPNDWITLNTLSGTGNTNLNVSIGANTISNNRTGVITITAGSNTKFLTINQQGKSSGINELVIGKQIKVFPNPANTEINVWVDNNVTKTYLVEITDINGKVVLETYSKSENTILPISQFANGTYVIHLSNSEFNLDKTIKFLKSNN